MAKIAIVGTGISGLTAAYRLAHEHQLTVFEANDWIGGHTHTADVELGGKPYAVDTGFIVHNDRTYPHFQALMRELGVATQPTEMSFSVKCERSGLEYNGNNLLSLFAQRRNLLRPSFWDMLRQILRFNREAPRLLDTPADGLTLGDYLAREGYGGSFIEHYIVPMDAAIWSSDNRSVLDFRKRKRAHPSQVSP
jgi:predicted NAD/FAD-binding protein